jgi:hypothetical protein
MKKLLFFSALFFLVSAQSQTTIYSENFEGGLSSIATNTSALGAANANNTWLINNIYTGGSGSLTCLGFPFAYTVNTTPAQPAGITNSPASTYMHITAQEAITDGITCASYLPSDGTCFFDETNFSQTSSPISTLGFTGVSHDFWWMCAGSSTAYGEIHYSLDGGLTWTLEQTLLNNQVVWGQTTLTNAAWDNQASLIFGYRFVNLVAATAADPPFCVDDIVVSGTAAANTITTATNIQPSAWCQGMTTTLQVNFTSTGTFNIANIYTAELSDATGSFATPMPIGTLVSTANSGTILSIVSGATPAGTGYRIRVVSDDPATIGSDNGFDLLITAAPTVDPVADQTVCNGDPTTAINFTSGTPGTTYSWSNNDPNIGLTSGGLGDIASFNGVNTGSIPVVGTITVSPSVNGCPGTPEVFTITVNPTPGVSFSTLSDVCIYTATFPISGGSPINGVYSGPGVVGLTFDPSVAGLGIHTLSYTYTDANTGCSGIAVQTILVNSCLSIIENGLVNLVLYPNPVSESFKLISDYAIESVQILDMSGRIVKSFGEALFFYDVSAIPSGVYMATVRTANRIGQLRIVIE